MPVIAGEIELAHTSREALLERARQWHRRPGRLDDLCLAGLVVAGNLVGDHAVDTVVLATSLGCLESDFEYYTQILERGQDQTNPRIFAYTLPNVVVGEIAIAFGLCGDNLCFSASDAWESRLAAQEAHALVETGRSRCALALSIESVGPGALRLVPGMAPDAQTRARGWLVTA